MGRTLQVLGLLLAAIAVFLYAMSVSDRPRPPALTLPPADSPSADLPSLERVSTPPAESEALAAIEKARQGEPAAALELIDRLIAEKGVTAVRQAIRGFVHLAAKDPAAARSDFDAALNREPGCNLALGGRARLRIATRRFLAAREDLALLTRKRPRHPEGWRLLAVASLGAKQVDAAFRAAERAVALAPNHHLTLTTMAACLLRMGREEEAAIWFRAGLARAPEETGSALRRERLDTVLRLIEGA